MYSYNNIIRNTSSPRDNKYYAVGSHQATLKELSRVRYELLKAKASPVQQEAPTAECTKALSSYHVSTEPQKGSRIKDALQQSEQSVSTH